MEVEKNIRIVAEEMHSYIRKNVWTVLFTHFRYINNLKKFKFYGFYYIINKKNILS